MLTNRAIRIGLVLALGFLWTAARPGVAQDQAVEPVRLHPQLAEQLAAASPDDSLLVLVSGQTAEDAASAVTAAGLSTVEVLDLIDVVAAVGTPDAVRALHGMPGVRRVDADPPLEWLDDTAHASTGVAQLRDPDQYPQLRRERRPDGIPYDGTGVSIAVVDSGFDPTHEQFVEDGESKFDVVLRQACVAGHDATHYFVGADPTPDCPPVWLAPTPHDDSYGHGTMVAAVAAGYQRVTPLGRAVSGAAPGARLVGLSTGTAAGTYNALSGLHWVLAHHDDPCGDGSCAAIRIVNNSYGIAADDQLGQRRFDPDSPMSVVTTALVRAGIVVVFGAGNDRGDGTTAKTNLLSLHPLPGVISAGGSDDMDVGDQNGGLLENTSRGKVGEPATYPDLIAPGARFLTGCAPRSVLCEALWPRDGHYTEMNGTSAAAPYVAGVVAQLLEANPSLSPADVEDVLEDSAYQGSIDLESLEPDSYESAFGSAGNDDHLTSFDAGHGLVDAVGAIGMARGRTARAAPAPECAGPEQELTDPADDTTLNVTLLPTLFVVGVGQVSQPSHDILRVGASLARTPGAITVDVVLGDIPDVNRDMFMTILVNLDGAKSALRWNTEQSGDEQTDEAGITVPAFYASGTPLEVTGEVHGDMVTFTARPPGPDVVIGRASVAYVGTARVSGREVDFTQSGMCLTTAIR